MSSGSPGGRPPSASAPGPRPPRRRGRRRAARAPARARRGGAGPVRHTEILSAGALEAYADCPVQLADRARASAAAARARARAARPRQPDPRRPRALLRRARRPGDARLARAGARRSSTGCSPSSRRPRRRRARVGSPEVVRAGALRAIEADLRRYLEHEAATPGGWRPLGLELRFGFEGEEGVAAGARARRGRRARARARRDRPRRRRRRRARRRPRLQERRRARPAWSAARWREDRQLQVALYMLVVRELTGLEPVGRLLPAAAGRGPARPRGVRRGDAGRLRRVATDARAAEELDEMLADAGATRGRAGGLAARRRSSTPCPQTCSRDGCAYPAICRSQ